MGINKKKPTKSSVNWLDTLIGALVDLIVGVLLLVISKIID